VRPWGLPEAIWAVLGAAVLVLLTLLPWQDDFAAIAKGTDVYFFLTGMMLLAEIARQEGSPQPVAFYAAAFFLVNATYIGLIWEPIHRPAVDEVMASVRRIMRIRSIATLCFFGLGAIVALKYPMVGLGVCISCPIFCLKPDPPRVRKHPSQG